MPHRDPYHRSNPETTFDIWLDAFMTGTPGSEATQDDPSGSLDRAIGGARQLHALAARATMPATAAQQRIRKDLMHSGAIAASGGTTWISEHQRERHAPWWSPASPVLATSLVLALIIGLVASLIWTQRPVLSPTANAPGFAVASPEGTANEPSLACDVPGYVPVIAGEIDTQAMRQIGVRGHPVVQTEDGYEIPETVGPIGSIEGDIRPVGNGFLVHHHDDGTASAVRIRDGETWIFVDLDSPNWPYPQTQVAFLLPYLVGPANEDGSDWLILDTRTGESITTSEITGSDAGGYISPDSVASNIRDSVGSLAFNRIRYLDATPTDGNDGPPPSDAQPFSVLLPGSVENTVHVSTQRPRESGFAASTNGRWFATDVSLYDGTTGEHVANLYDSIDRAGKVIGFHDDEAPTLFVLDDSTVYLVDPFAGEGEDIFTAEQAVTRVLFNALTHTMVLFTSYQEDVTAIWLDPASGESRELPELTTLSLHRYAASDVTSIGDGTVRQVTKPPIFIEAPADDGDTAGTMHVLDMATGTLRRTANDAEIAWSPSGSHHYTAHYQQGFIGSDLAGDRFQVIDPASNEQFEFGLPESVSLDDTQSARYSLSPEGACVMLQIMEENREQAGNTWVAPLEDDAEWIELEFQLVDWWHIGDDPAEPRTLPALDFATPFPSTTDDETLSCSAPGYRPIIWTEDVTAADIEAAGLSGMPINPGENTTVEAANGTQVTLPGGTWSLRQTHGNLVLTGPGESTSVTSLTTGESWTIDAFNTGYVVIGSWLVGATDDTATDFWIINTETGASLRTSEFFGAPFTDARTPDSLVPRGAGDGAAVYISFIGTYDTDRIPDVIVLPSADLDDVWALDPDDAPVAANGTITPDGSRIVFGDTPGEAIHVLGGFTGEHVATHVVSAPDTTAKVIGFASDGTTLLLRDNQRLLAIDINTGETTPLLDPDVTVRMLVFDPATGTAVVNVDGLDITRNIWLDPLSGEVKELDIANPEALPRPDDGWAMFQTREGPTVEHALLDMATGEFIDEPLEVTGGDPRGTAFLEGSDAGVWVLEGDPGQLLVFDGPGNRSFQVQVPTEIDPDSTPPSYGVTPSGECLFYSSGRTIDGPSTSWIAPLKPDPEWTELPFDLTGWLEVPIDTPDTRPGLNIATPEATPAAIPVAALVATPPADTEQCEVTLPNDQAPPGEDDLIGWYGSRSKDPSLWLLMTWENGVESATGTTSDGYAVKLTFWRGEASGPVEVTAAGPDGATHPARAFEPFRDTTMPGMHPMGGILPEPGCWIFTATDGNDTLTWTMLVTEVDTGLTQVPPGASPITTSTPDSVFIVEGDTEQARIEGNVTIATLNDNGLTLPLASGETVTLPNISGVDIMALGDNQLLAYRSDQNPVVIDVSTGEIVHELPQFQTWGREFGRWYMVPTDDTLTDWTIADIATGETRLLSEVVDLPGDTSVMPFPSVNRPVGDVPVFDVQPGTPENQRWVPSGPPIGNVAIGGPLDRMYEVAGFPTARDRVGSPVMIEGGEGRIIAYETRTDADRIVIVNMTTGQEMARYGVNAVGDDPTLAGFMGADTLVITREGRVMLLRASGDNAEVVHEGLEGVANPLLYSGEAMLYFTQGDAVMRLDLPADELTDITSGFVPGGFSFTRSEGSDWIFFQTQDGVTLVEAASGEIVSQMKLPGARGGFPGADERWPQWTNADGDTLVIAIEGQGMNASGVPGSISLLSPEFPNGLEIPGPSDEHPIGNAFLSPDGTTLYATAREQVSSEGELWMTPLGEEPSWELIAEGVTVRTFVPTAP